MNPYPFQEATLPLDHCQIQAQQIMTALARFDSILVVGLAGMGKSSIIRFCVAHSQAQRHYLGAQAAQFTFVHVDCNHIDATREEPVLTELSEQLNQVGLAALLEASKTDNPIHPLRQAVRQQIKALGSDRYVVIFFDPFDAAFQPLTLGFFSFLRSLRDPEKNVCFVFGCRRLPSALAELQDIMASPCWVGPASEQDALALLERREKILGTNFSHAAKKTMIALTGGHPSLLKQTAALVHDEAVQLDKELDVIATQLFESDKSDQMQYACQELWVDLTPQERETLKLSVEKIPTRVLNSAIIKYLAKAGLLRKDKSGEYVLFSKLFEKFVAGQELERVIYLHVGLENQVEIRSWKGVQMVQLTPLPFQLLQVMASHPATVRSWDDLFESLWPGEKKSARTVDAFDKNMWRLRQPLNPILRDLTGDPRFQSITAAGRRGFKLNTMSRGGWRLEYTVEG